MTASILDFINKHFTAILVVLGIVFAAWLWITVELFKEFKADAVREEKEDPTRVAVQLVLSTYKNFLLLRKAAKGEVLPSSSPRTSQELDATITPGSVKAGDLPKPPARTSTPV